MIMPKRFSMYTVTVGADPCVRPVCINNGGLAGGRGGTLIVTVNIDECLKKKAPLCG